MKKFLLLALSVFAIETSFAQTASDYYIPLCVGNYLKFYTPNGGGGGWEARTTFYSIVHADSINGEVFYLQKGYEVMTLNPIDTNVFHYFWLRKDVNGEILIGAYDFTGSGIIDSATIVPPGAVFFSNQFLTLGFSQTQSGGNVTYSDSIISISATVGAYTNCIQKRNTRKTNGIIDMMEDTYYVYHIGAVKVERFIPTNQVHVASIIDFVATNCYSTGISDGFENKKELSLYPNPASDIVTLKIDNSNNTELTLNIYNLMGELVKSEMLKQNQQQINIGDLSSGVYMVTIKSKDFTENQKLIIQR